jgi:formylglycine-generating enzyme required for sulfatase activity
MARKSSVWAATAVAASAIAGASGAAAPPTREAAYAAWKAAHPNPDAEVAALKARTAELIDSYVAFIPAITPELQPSTRELRLDRPTVTWKVAGGIKEVWDFADAPQMVVIPAGEFSMGSPDAEANRRATETPRHRVRIGYALAVSKYPVTVYEFSRYVAESGAKPAGWCQGFVEEKWENKPVCSWDAPGFPQTEDSPVVTLDWSDATAYADWLSKKTGHKYRLLSEAEYEYVNRAGTTTPYWWGSDPKTACEHANAADLDLKAAPSFGVFRTSDCKDGYVATAPAGKFKPNPFGLYDTTGNAWSWTQDCWNDSYYGAPADGSPWLTGICAQRVVRGGAFAERPEQLRSARRGWNFATIRFAMNSFRVAREL